MTKVQEALKAAQKVICEGIYSEDGMDGDDGQKALLAIDAALSELEKCEPVGFIIQVTEMGFELADFHHPSTAWPCGRKPMDVGTKLYTKG